MGKRVFAMDVQGRKTKGRLKLTRMNNMHDLIENELSDEEAQATLFGDDWYETMTPHESGK